MTKKAVNRSAWDAKYNRGAKEWTVTVCWRPTRSTQRKVIVDKVTPSLARSITDASNDLITQCERVVLAVAVGLPEDMHFAGPRSLKDGAFRVDSLSQEKRKLIQTILDSLDNLKTKSWVL